MKPGTGKRYKTQWKDICKVLSLRKKLREPIPSKEVGVYLAHLADTGRYGSVGVACAAITFHHTIRGWISPIQNERITLLRRAIKREGLQVRKTGLGEGKRPFKPGEVRLILEYCDSKSSTSRNAYARLGAAVAYAYSYGLRANEVFQQRISDVPGMSNKEEDKNGNRVFLAESKSDKFNAGSFRYGGERANTEQRAALQRIRKYVGDGNGGRKMGGYVFVNERDTKRLRPISYSAMRDLLKHVCLKLQLGWKDVGWHSFRKGCATEIRKRGCSWSEIRKRLGHKKGSHTARETYCWKRGKPRVSRRS